MDKKLLKLLTVTGVFLVITLLTGLVLKLVVPEEWFSDFTLNCVRTILTEIVVTAVCVFLSVKVFKIKININSKKLVKGVFWYGLVLCIAIIFNFVSGYIAPEKSITGALSLILLSFIAMMCVGVQEELVFRGLLFGACRDYFGESKNGIYLSVFISSLIFGCMHLPNIVFTPDLVVATVTQAIYATEIGILFAVIYYRSDNLLPCILLHGLFDFSSTFWMCFAKNANDILNAQNTSDIDIASAFGMVALCLPFMISGLWQMRTICKRQQIMNDNDIS